jgi:hypothetical protein
MALPKTLFMIASVLMASGHALTAPPARDECVPPSEGPGERAP